jgi:hypothetical protein
MFRARSATLTLPDYGRVARHPLALTKLNQSRIRWFETTFVEIIATQVIFKIYVEPSASSLASLSDRYGKHFGSYTLHRAESLQ